MILNEGNHLNNAPSHKSNHAENGKKSTLIIGDSIVKNTEGWKHNKRMKSTVHVKSIFGATTKGMKHHVRGYLEDNSPDTAILHFGTNNLKNNESAEVLQLI